MRRGLRKRTGGQQGGRRRSLQSAQLRQRAPARWGPWLDHQLTPMVPAHFYKISGLKVFSVYPVRTCKWLSRWGSAPVALSDVRLQKDHQRLEKGMAVHSSILAWRIPWTEEPSGLQSIGLQKSQKMTEQLTHT